MAKSRKSKPRKKSRRSTRRPRAKRGMSSLPPPLSFNGLKCNTTFRSSILLQIQDNSLLAHDFSIKDLSKSYPQMISCFKEVKIMKVKFWLVTTLSAASSGVISFCVTPKDMVNSKDSYANFSCTPGAMTRKSYQTLHGMYFPTEPDERNWFPIDSTKHLLTLQIFGKDLPKSSGTDTSVEVQIIYDAHLAFRGKAATQTGLANAFCDEFEIIPSQGVEAMSLVS